MRRQLQCGLTLQNVLPVLKVKTFCSKSSGNYRHSISSGFQYIEPSVGTHADWATHKAYPATKHIQIVDKAMKADARSVARAMAWNEFRKRAHHVQFGFRHFCSNDWKYLVQHAPCRISIGPEGRLT